MGTSAGTTESPRIAVLGSQGAFTEVAVRALCESGVTPVALLTGSATAPAARGPVPLEIPTPAGRSAAMHGVAWVQAPHPNHPDAIAALERVEPDLLLLACLPHVVRHATRRVARLGALNLHPSALPRFRGPHPVFRQLRAGIARAGVTVHVATDIVDAGPIVVQGSIEVRPGIRAGALTEALVRCGIRALVGVLPDIERRIRGARPQDESAATRAPHPRVEDFRLDTSWTAERAYRFVEGARGPATVFTIASDEGEIEIVRAIEFGDRARTAPEVRRSGETVTIRFADGVLRAVPAPPRQPSTASSSSKPNVDMSRMRIG